VTGGGAAGTKDVLGEAESFLPLLVQQIDEPVDLVTFTRACLVGSKRQLRKLTKKGAHVDRALSRVDGGAVGDLETIDVLLDGEGESEDVYCGNVVDILPATALRDGEYVFEASLKMGGKEALAADSVHFAIGIPTTDPAP